jgi:mRNA interferase YafQ
LLNLERTKAFIKDISKVKFTNTQYGKYILYIGKLLNEEALPYEARDHRLQGNWGSFREFHISGDLIVIYKIGQGILYLVRIGTHSQLFK